MTTAGGGLCEMLGQISWQTISKPDALCSSWLQLGSIKLHIKIGCENWCFNNQFFLSPDPRLAISAFLGGFGDFFICFYLIAGVEGFNDGESC